MTDPPNGIRATNEEIARLVRRLHVDPRLPIAFLCECDPSCGGFVRLSVDEFEAHRRNAEPLVDTAHASTPHPRRADSGPGPSR